MKRVISITILVLCLARPGVVRADDTEIYGGASVSVEPNILIIFDTSGTMSINDVPGEYYDPSITYSGSYTTNAVYQKVWGWSWSYELFADNVDDLNCPDVKASLLANGRVSGKILDSSSNYNCGGTEKDLYMGNWINYDENYGGAFRTRIDVAQEVITKLINDTENVRFGLMRFNSSEGGRIVKECGSTKTELIDAVNGLNASGWTPLAETLAEAGLYFAGKDSWFNSGTYTSPMQYRCQKNYVILMTDGQPTQDDNEKLRTGTYINGDTIGDYDNDGDDGPGSNQYLDDVAKYLFENDCNSTLGTAGGSFERQNIITYTIGFQIQQNLLFETATRGGGEYYTANSISGLSAAFEDIISAIADVNAVFVSPVVPVSRMNRTYSGNSIYVGFFKPQQTGRWSGNIKKYGLDSSGKLIDADGIGATLSDGTIKDNARSYWSVSADGPDVLAGGIGGVLLDQASRNLYTYIGAGADLTHTNNRFSTSNTLITKDVLNVATDTERQDLINDIHGGGRSWILGDILHSQPAVVHYDETSTFIFTGSNDGMMHCFNDSDGRELWGFIPPDQLGRLHLLSDAVDDHDYFVDGAPRVYEGASQKVLFFGERRGGDYYYGLDVTTPATPRWLYKIEPDHLVNLDGDGDGNADGVNATLGQSWCNPMIAKIKTSSGSDTVFLMGGGYDENQDADNPSASDTKGRAVFAIKISDGTVSSLNVNAGYYSPMTHCIVGVSGFDTDANGFVNRVYAGDLGGQIFAFEDDNADGTWTHRKLFSAGAIDGVQRKILYAPDAVGEDYGELIFFGTGDRADPEETGVVNRLYAIKNDWEDSATLDESDLVDVTDDLIHMGNEDQKVAAEAALLASKGWYIKLENPGEKITSALTVYAGVVYFTTYTPEAGGGGGGSDPCIVVSGRGTARLYAVDYLTGAAVHDFSDVEETDAAGNVVERGKLDRNKVVGTSIASAPVIAVLASGPKMYIGVEGGVAAEDPVATADMNSFYWRQIF